MERGWPGHMHTGAGRSCQGCALRVPRSGGARKRASESEEPWEHAGAQAHSPCGEGVCLHTCQHCLKRTRLSPVGLSLTAKSQGRGRREMQPPGSALHWDCSSLHEGRRREGRLEMISALRGALVYSDRYAGEVQAGHCLAGSSQVTLSRERERDS